MRYNKIIDKVLGQKSKIKILRYFSLKGAVCSGREIARKAGVNHWICNKVLRELHMEGVLNVQKVGNMYLYGLRRGSYLVDRIIEPLFQAESAGTQSLMDELKKHKYPGVISIVLFGSIVKRKTKPHSDIDILVITKTAGYKNKILREINEKNEHFLAYYGNSLSPYIISKSEFKKRVKNNDALIGNIVKEGRIVSGQTIGEIITE